MLNIGSTNLRLLSILNDRYGGRKHYPNTIHLPHKFKSSYFIWLDQSMNQRYRQVPGIPQRMLAMYNWCQKPKTNKNPQIIVWETTQQVSIEQEIERPNNGSGQGIQCEKQQKTENIAKKKKNRWKEKRWEMKANMEEIDTQKNKDGRMDMYLTEGTERSPVSKYCCGPMLHQESKGLSQLSHIWARCVFNVWSGV